jgi:hypothetical protein
LHDKFSGCLSLPDGPLIFTGRVRSLIPLEGRADLFMGLGGELAATSADQQRLERFLFGSDLQWTVNGYLDQFPTPLSYLMPRAVPGPTRSPFANAHWSAVRVSAANGESSEALLSFSYPASPDSASLLSFAPLPEGGPLRLEGFHGQPTVRLQRVETQEVGPMVFIYRVRGINQNLTSVQMRATTSISRLATLSVRSPPGAHPSSVVRILNKPQRI